MYDCEAGAARSCPAIAATNSRLWSFLPFMREWWRERLSPP